MHYTYVYLLPVKFLTLCFKLLTSEMLGFYMVLEVKITSSLRMPLILMHILYLYHIKTMMGLP